ncbi:MAG: hypothetical protein KatS3mg090_0738 [Patescibacteria group bacterium]|nr:MAG: hypothetical protein KatS3mg090_0738 [Patescibacteria group bacterium]
MSRNREIGFIPEYTLHSPMKEVIYQLYDPNTEQLLLPYKNPVIFVINFEGINSPTDGHEIETIKLSFLPENLYGLPEILEYTLYDEIEQELKKISDKLIRYYDEIYQGRSKIALKVITGRYYEGLFNPNFATEEINYLAPWIRPELKTSVSTAILPPSRKRIINMLIINRVFLNN